MRVDVQCAALRIRRIRVGARTDHEFALVRLTDIRMNGVRHDHARENGFHRLRYQRLQRIALERQLHARERQHHAGIAGRRDPDLAGADDAASRLQPRHRAAGIAIDARHFAVLDDVHAQLIGRARKAPGHGIVPGRAAAPLQRRAQYRIPDVLRDIEQRAELLGLNRFEPLVVDAVAAIRMHVALGYLDVVHRVRQHHDAARREHDVVVQVLR